MIRLRITDAGADLHLIEPDAIENYRLGGQKLIADDFFMNEPASADIGLIYDAWLAEKLESDTIKIGQGMWFKYPVAIDQLNPETGNYELLITGLIDLTQCDIRPYQKRMKIVVYDYSALLSQLDLPVRFYYPYSPATGTDFSRFIINYALPGESEITQPEDHPANTQFFAYPHQITTSSRRISAVLAALADIWRQYFAGTWNLSFAHTYLEMPELTDVVENHIVEIDGSESFYNAFVMGVVGSALSHLNQSGFNATFRIKYGLLGAENVPDIYQEYGLALHRLDAEAFLVMRALYYQTNVDYIYEWYRIFAFQAGRQIYDSGQRHFAREKTLDINVVVLQKVGSANLTPTRVINVTNVPTSRSYRVTQNSFTLPDQNAILAYLSNFSFYTYYSGDLAPQPEWVSDQPLTIGNSNSFYPIFIDEMVLPAYNQFKALATNRRYFWANYAFITAEQRHRFLAEYGFTPGDSCDGFFLLRVGYTYTDAAKDHYHDPADEDIPHDHWTDGEGGGGSGGATPPPQYLERYRLFALAAGEVQKDYGATTRSGVGARDGSTLGGLPISPAADLSVGANSFYTCTKNNLNALPANPADYLASLLYNVSFTGYAILPTSWLSNRIFRMKTIPQNAGQEQYLTQSLREWFKIMFFLANISCFADPYGTIHFAPRLPLAATDIPWNMLIDAYKSLLIYQPWDATKLEEYINDAAEIDYLITYYGGKKDVSHTLNLVFVRKNWDSMPALRQKIALDSARYPILAPLGSGWYMITEIAFEGINRLNLKAIKIS